MQSSRLHFSGNLAGGQLSRAAPVFSPDTIETRGVPNLFCVLYRKGSCFDLPSNLTRHPDRGRLPADEGTCFGRADYERSRRDRS
jgi:hypothetical protein